MKLAAHDRGREAPNGTGTPVLHGSPSGDEQLANAQADPWNPLSSQGSARSRDGRRLHAVGEETPIRTHSRFRIKVKWFRRGYDTIASPRIHQLFSVSGFSFEFEEEADVTDGMYESFALQLTARLKHPIVIYQCAIKYGHYNFSILK